MTNTSKSGTDHDLITWRQRDFIQRAVGLVEGLEGYLCIECWIKLRLTRLLLLLLFLLDVMKGKWRRFFLPLIFFFLFVRHLLTVEIEIAKQGVSSGK